MYSEIIDKKLLTFDFHCLGRKGTFCHGAASGESFSRLYDIIIIINLHNSLSPSQIEWRTN
jgi:hypothetical protein